MPISIKNGETEALIRKLTKITGESLTDAIRRAIEERIVRLSRERAGRSLADELNEIALRCASRPPVSALSADDILGYDEYGAPAR